MKLKFYNPALVKEQNRIKALLKVIQPENLINFLTHELAKSNVKKNKLFKENAELRYRATRKLSSV